MHFETLPHKIKQFFALLIKLSIVVGAFYFIYYKLTQNEDLSFGDFIAFTHKNNVFSIKNGLILSVLSIFNWVFEILKWKTLVDIIQPISFKKATEQSLGSLTASLFTPNRIGEYGAKAMYFKKEERKKIVGLNVIGNTAQMLVTTCFGVVGLFYFDKIYQLNFDNVKILKLVVFISVLLIIIGILLKKKVFKVKWFSFEKTHAFYKLVSKKTKLFTIVFSIIRYGVFSFQLYYLLLIFGVNISYTNAMIIICSMYLLASIIPSIFIFDVVIKGSIAVYLFDFAGVNQLTILSSITLMWLLNFVIPSVLGSYYILNFKLPNSKTI